MIRKLNKENTQIVDEPLTTWKDFVAKAPAWVDLK